MKSICVTLQTMRDKTSQCYITDDER